MIAASSLEVGLSWWQGKVHTVHPLNRTDLDPSMAVRLDRLFHRRLLHCSHRSYRRQIPHQLSRDQQSFLWYLWISLAGPQPIRHGLYLVRSPGLDWWSMCISHDCLNLAIVPSSTSAERHHRVRCNGKLFHRLHHLLARLLALHLVPSSQDSPPLHCQINCCADWWHCLVRVVYRSCRRRWPNRSTRPHCPRLRPSLGNHRWYHEQCQQFRYTDR
jgi:hypothetical protein